MTHHVDNGDRHNGTARRLRLERWRWRQPQTNLGSDHRDRFRRLELGAMLVLR